MAGVEKSLFTHFAMDTNEDNFLAYYPSPYMAKAHDGKSIRQCLVTAALSLMVSIYVGNLKVKWFNMELNNNETVRLVGSDLLFAGFSILFVVIWLRVHTGSWFIAALGIYMIAFSLPFSLFIYKFILQIPFYSEVLYFCVLFCLLIHMSLFM